MKKFFSFLVFLFLLFSVPISAYFLMSDYDFDRRTEAAIFNNLVQDLEVFIDEAPVHAPGIIRLEFPDYVSSAEIEDIIGGPRTTPADLLHTPFERVEYIEVDAGNMGWEMAKYERYYPTESVDLDYIPHFDWEADGNSRVLPIDWNASNHWYFNKIKLPEVWKMQGCLEGSNTCGGSKDITVAVIDTGLAFNAPEAQGMNIFSHPSYNRNSHIDREGHGTYVAGIIASTVGNQANSPVGMAHNVTILPLIGGSGPPGGTERTLYEAAEHANVINMSWGIMKFEPGRPPTKCFPLPTIYDTVLNYAYNRGVVLVSSSGNTGEPCLNIPESHPRVISVGSVNANNSRSSYSSYGSNLDFVAPAGEGNRAGTSTWHQTLSCFPRCTRGSNLNSFATGSFDGTSFSAPQVAAAAALILSLDPSLSAGQVKDVLIKTVDDIGPPGKDAQTGYGLLNLENIYKYFAAQSPACGDLNGQDFEHTQQNWPSKNFCSPGAVDPAEPEFPGLGRTTTWACKGGDGTSVSCSASRKAPPEPLCGELNGSNFEPDANRWPSRNFCAGGVPEPSYPQFPPFGGSTQWRCFESYDNSFVSCSASRKPAPSPACGSLDGSKFLPDDETWPSDNFCSSGVASPRTPRFPVKGRTTTWKCVALDNEFVTCSAERGSCSSNSDCRSRPPYEVCVKHFCLRGDINNDGKVDSNDFGAFQDDFLTFKKGRWNSKLIRSDLNTDYKLTMADYSIFVKTYRAFNNLD